MKNETNQNQEVRFFELLRENKILRTTKTLKQILTYTAIYKKDIKEISASEAFFNSKKPIFNLNDSYKLERV